MKTYNFKCVKECAKFCCKTPVCVSFDKIKNYYKYAPFFFQVSFFTKDYLSGLNDKFFNSNLIDSSVRVGFGKTLLIAVPEILLGLPDNECVFLKNDNCSIYENKPTVCSLYPLERFLPLKYQGKALEFKKTFCRGIGQGDFLIDGFGSKVNSFYFNKYLEYLKNLKVFSNSITILKNLELILETQSDPIYDKLQKLHTTTIVSPFRPLDDFFAITDIKRKDYKKFQLKALKDYESSRSVNKRLIALVYDILNNL